VTANATPEFSQTALHDADEELNQVWNKLTAKQRARLRREERDVYRPATELAYSTGRFCYYPVCGPDILAKPSRRPYSDGGA
jgi:hypothetical protein